MPGIISGEHSFMLSPVGDGTHLVQSESFRGLLVPFSAKTFASAEVINEALKKRAEAS